MSEVKKNSKEQTVSVERDFCVCPECTRDLVDYEGVQKVSRTLTLVALYCPNCEWHEVEVLSPEQCDKFAAGLDDGEAALNDTLKKLTEENNEAEVQRFAAALACNALLPEDF